MKISILIITFVFIQNLIFAQYEKLEELYKSSKYEKCLKEADNILKTNSKAAEPYYYKAVSEYQLFKIGKSESDKKNNLKNALKYCSKAKSKDAEGKAITKFESTLQELHDSVTVYALRIYESKNKDNSKVFYDYLAEVFKDTTSQFRTFYKSKNEKSNNSGSTVLLEIVNQVDNNGKKHGLWRKQYANGKNAYEVNFRNGKPVGEYKRYHENGKLNALLFYDNNGEFAKAEMFDEDGYLTAKGVYYKQLRDSTWNYYSGQGKRLVAVENYVKGKKHGSAKVFFENGKVAEENNWADDLKHGEEIHYFDNGKRKMRQKYSNGKLEGTCIYYNSHGNIVLKGEYKNGLMQGIWSHFDDNGKVVQEINYINGVAENAEELEEIESKKLEEFMKPDPDLKNPEDYRGNPEEYFNGNK